MRHHTAAAVLLMAALTLAGVACDDTDTDVPSVVTTRVQAQDGTGGTPTTLRTQTQSTLDTPSTTRVQAQDGTGDTPTTLRTQAGSTTRAG